MTIFSEFAIDAVRLAINSAIIGSLVALSAATALRFAPSLHPRIRYAIAVGAFLAAVVFPVFAAFQIFDGNQPLALVVQNSELESPEKTRIESANDFAVQPPLNQTPNQNPPPAESFSGEISAKNPVIAISPIVSNVFLLSWSLIAFLLLAREIFGHLSFAGKRRKWRTAGESLRRELQIPEKARVYLSDGESPLAIGVFRPAIVLPARLSDDLSVEATRQIVRHELNHLQWRDPSVNALLRIIRALFWINPPLWFLERAARLEREAAADFAVVEIDNFDAEKIAAYAGALVEMAKRDSTARREFKFVAAEIGRRSGLEKRVRRLFQARARLNFLRRTLAVSIVCAGLCGIYFLPLAAPAASSSANALIVAESGAENFSPPTSVENTEPEILSFDNSSTLPANRVSESFAQTPRDIVDRPAAERAENKPESIDAGAGFKETPQPSLLFENAGSENIAPVAPVNTSAHSAAAVAPTPPNVETAPPTEQPAPKNYEAPPNFIRDGMASVGYPDLSDEEIAALKRVGASHFTVRELASVGYTNLPVKTLVRLRENGVGAAFIREMKALGYANLSPETLCDFRWHGVSREFIGELAAAGYKNLTANQLVSMRQHGVTTAFIEKMRARDGKNYSANDLISMRMNGER